MSADLINEMGYIALATRLKRISDKMSHSTRLMYKQIDMDIEPNWYLVLILVKEKPNISVMEIAKSMGFTHQSVNTITSKMMKKGYLKISKDTKDKRKTVFNITSKSIDALPEIEKIWGIGKKVIYELLDEDITILKHLNTLESNLNKTSFGQRIINKLESTENEKT
ncbi:MarR family winged helix-turn-helix transcriptional regulator [Tenacibaculum ovolyticum]|uniref:MarR family winged helix-turn-helix transcriptional regulator n=1 Tax=Tenacibaculum ovolyticum TaxID=104270 RepID=UPI0009EDF3F8|nr:MarR family transcriptional regulator [Tenacibaculum ovolyticum]